MKARVRALMMLAATGMGLGGCVAAVVPIAASGMIARRHAAKRQATTEKAPATPATSSTAVATLPAVPADPAAMQPGQLYRGSLPPGTSAAEPTPSTPADPDRPVLDKAATVAGGKDPPRQDWTAFLHYVAGHYAQPPANSVLLQRGTTLATPTWLPCGTRPVAVLVDLDAVVGATGTVGESAGSVLGALQTLQVTIAYTSRRTGPGLSTALSALDTADLNRPQPGTDLFTAGPAARAAAGARYCVIAIAGDQVDFPSTGADPVGSPAAWPPAWFLVPPGR